MNSKNILAFGVRELGPSPDCSSFHLLLQIATICAYRDLLLMTMEFAWEDEGFHGLCSECILRKTTLEQ